MAVKEFWKSVHICQSYDKKSSVLFFFRHSVYMLTKINSCLPLEQTASWT